MKCRSGGIDKHSPESETYRRPEDVLDSEFAYNGIFHVVAEGLHR